MRTPGSIFLAGFTLLFVVFGPGCHGGPDRSVTIRVLSHTVPKGDTLFVAGDLDVLGNMSPNAVMLERMSDSLWEHSFNTRQGTDVVYGISRGTIRKRAMNPRGTQYSWLQVVHVAHDTTVTLHLPRWMDVNGGTTYLTENDIVLNTGFWIVDGWRYHAGDDSSWAFVRCNDSSWEITRSLLNAVDVPVSGWNGLGWFRLNLEVDTLLWNQPLALKVFQPGASELYLDGKLLYKFGVIGTALKEENASFDDRNPKVISFTPERHHVLAIRYSNLRSTPLQRQDKLSVGFALRFEEMDKAIATMRSSRTYQMVFVATLATLAFVHFMLFLFYPRFKENLFYALSTLGIAGITYLNNQIRDVIGSKLITVLDRLTQDSQIIAVVFGLLMAYSLAYGKIPKRAAIFVLPGIALVLWVHIDLSEIFIKCKDGFTVLALIEILWHFIISLKRNRDTKDASIVGIGFTVLAVTVLYEVQVGQGIIRPIAGLTDTYIVGALAFGVSMSVFLSRRFAHTHHRLEEQLVQVRELSERTLAQERQAREAEIERRVLETDNARKTQELEEARKIQLSMLPAEPPLLPDLDIAVYMKTATEIGGDYYDFDTAPDGTLTVALGDATGHGTKAGMMVVIAKSRFSALCHLDSLPEIFERMTTSIRRLRVRSMYMGMLLVRIKDNVALLSSAGMPCPIVYRAATRTVEEVTLKGMPLGCFLNFPYEEKEVRLSPGDTIVVMSDGLPEMFNHQQETLDYSRVKEIVAHVGHKSPQEIIAHLSKTGEEWANGRVQDDDVTFVVLQVKLNNQR